ncbi:MAG: transglycosylase domain-containing protein [Micavibrio sp.]
MATDIQTDGNNDSDPLDHKTEERPPAPPRRKRRRLAYSLAAAFGVVATAGIELETSFIQSQIFHSIAKDAPLTTRDATSAPAAGPYDSRLGYTFANEFRQRLLSRGFIVTPPVEWQDRKVFGVRLFPIYNEKAQAGLQITDDTNAVVYASRFPRQTYSNYESIPPLLVQSLLFVENRELGNDHAASWNPAVDWGRMANAVLEYGAKKLGVGGEHSGGSTLATQIEKFRHSPEGITGSPSEKLRQMLTASVRSYQNGSNTVEARHQIVLNYLNSMPLAAYPKFGEVNGFGDGMALWFGADFEEVNHLLTQPEENLSAEQLQRKAVVYRESLSLVMAVKKPSAYLRREREALDQRVDNFLPLLAEAGIISPRLKDLALAARVNFADPTRESLIPNVPREKSIDSLRVELMQTLNVKGGLYDLDRLDLTASTTIDGRASREVAQILRSLADPEVAQARGLIGYQLLKPDAADDIVYSFSLYEKTADGNVLRVQTDNFNGPLNLNEGSKLELGSTAKLRTLVSYLEAITDLHGKYAGQDATTLNGLVFNRDDNLSRWAVEYLSAPETDKSLNAMLEASLERRYSANPGERFFTGGGVHTFNNFDRKDNGGYFTVKDSFHNSINLPFIRMMRDIVNYTMSHKMQVDPTLFDDPENPLRQKYLDQFAHSEGTGFMWRFWNTQKDKSPEEVAAILAEKTRRTPLQLAVLYRSIFPDAPYQDMDAFIRKECTNCAGTDNFNKLYEDHAPGKFNLNDRGYLTRIHPLSLWLAAYKIKNPNATWDQAVTDSTDERLEVYKWLFQPGKVQGQNTRIRTILEREAFTHIHKTWEDKGFSFSTMVPSYASALGASGDTPAALAELVGILQNDGVRKAPIRFRDIQFAQNTPYAMTFHTKPDSGVRVLPAELTQLVRREMQGVVEEGTGRRVLNAVTLSDGRVLRIGAKTGTGDNRLQTFASNGGVTSSNAKSRTATFVFAIDDRFYGCVTAYVDGPEAGEHKFTSALASQVFKNLIPAIRPIMDRSYGVTPEQIIQAENLAGKKPPSITPR